MKKGQCRNCWWTSKMVETIIDDEFVFDEETKERQAVGFSDDFIHTGIETCKDCWEDWKEE